MNKIRDFLRKQHVFKKISKSINYARLRQLFKMTPLYIEDDRQWMADAQKVLIDWPIEVNKPTIGIIKDFGSYARWSKYCRFLEQNSFVYGFLDIQSIDWIDHAKKFDAIVGILSNEFYFLQELRQKFYVLEKYLGKNCYPSYDHLLLYEDKTLEAYISSVTDLKFASTYVYYSEQEAIQAIEYLHYPIISKIVPSSGSMGVELVHNYKQARRIIRHAFSNCGRPTHRPYFRQKNFVYFQEYLSNDGYDIRVIIVGDYAFGYYRKVPRGDFRASGMSMVEKREIPEEALRIARKAYKIINSPQLVVDMVHTTDGQYYIIEYSPFCLMETPKQLEINGTAGAYIFNEDHTIDFKPGKFWVHELALKQFLLNEYINTH